jgi:lipoprotein-anchoring transpeptidase ErfK/SrfK
MSVSPRSVARATSVAIALLFVAVVAGCGSKASDAGGNFRLSADQLEPTTTSTLPSHTTTTAEAKGGALEVFRDEPTAGAVPGAAPAAFNAASLQPIPRPGLNYAFAQTTPTGWVYKNPTYFGNPLVLVVTQVDGDWVKVSIPARPNGQEGWVRASDVNLSQHAFHAELVLSERLFTVWDDNTPIAQTNVVVGKDSTPTPLGTFYIAEKIPASVAGVSPNGAYGPWILATSAYSEALDEFDGGLPVIAFHGTNQPDLIGSAASNGCIRMPNDVVSELADTIPAGTPVTIRE